MKKGVLAILISILICSGTFGQLAGSDTYRFLDLTSSALSASLGGYQAASTLPTVNQLYCNPALLGDTLRGELGVNYSSYIAGIQIGQVMYVPKSKGRGQFALGIHYVNYGSFQGADETGNLTDSFGASEYAFLLLYSRKISSNVTLGVNAKPILSSFETYKSMGIACDVGVHYLSNDGQLAMAVVARNIGTQITTYYDNGVHESLPFDLCMGISKRLTHAPLIFYATANHLTESNLSVYYDPSLSNQAGKADESIGSRMIRHVVLGVDLLPSRFFDLAVGYNFQRHKELSIDQRPGLVGFSAGVGIHLASFEFRYAASSYHLSGVTHCFSLSTNLRKILGQY